MFLLLYFILRSVIVAMRCVMVSIALVELEPT